MNSKHLVLGATGSIGYAYTNLLVSKGIKTTIFVRNIEKAKKMFDDNSLLKIVEGDVNNVKELKSVSFDKDFIFCGINVPYHLWGKQMEHIISNVILSAKQNRATILFPENNYAFGNITMPITEKTIPHPTTKKGRIRLNLVNQLKKASENGECKVIIIRLPDFFGPNVINGLIKPIFEEAINNKSIKWMINTDIPHQFSFTPDIAKYFYLLTLENNLPNFFLINYSGITVSSIKYLSEKISRIQGNPKKVKVAPKFILNIIALLSPEVKELKENFYQFENSIILDSDKLKKMYPKFNETKLETALKITLDWYENNMK